MTGGAWFNDSQELDVAFINTLRFTALDCIGTKAHPSMLARVCTDGRTDGRTAGDSRQLGWQSGISVIVPAAFIDLHHLAYSPCKPIAQPLDYTLRNLIAASLNPP